MHNETFMPITIIEGGVWVASSDRNPAAVAMFMRHYSRHRKPRPRSNYYRQGFVGPTRKLILMTSDGTSLFAWAFPKEEFNDGYEGVRCTIFRNEGHYLSSDLIKEADKIAWNKWPEAIRHYTWVWDVKVASSNPGYCFKKAGWVAAGRNKTNELTLLEINHLTERNDHDN